MPSLEHEALVELFRRRPELVMDMLPRLGIGPSPSLTPRVVSGNLTSKSTTAFQADVVVQLLDGDSPALAVIVEVQLRPDEEKRKSWPNYVTLLFREQDCPAMLLVVCPGEGTAKWAAEPIHTGHPEFDLVPLVLGPSELPVITDPKRARQWPELAVLSTVAHGNTHPARMSMFGAFLEGLNAFEQERADAYTEVLRQALSGAARRQLEEYMSFAGFEIKTTVFRDVYTRGEAEGRAAGEASGEARAVLEVLAARGIEVPDTARSRITECTDLEQLSQWVRRAVTVDSVKALFA